MNVYLRQIINKVNTHVYVHTNLGYERIGKREREDWKEIFPKKFEFQEFEFSWRRIG